VKVAVGSGKVAVPELKGMSLTQAAAALSAAGLTRGPDLVPPADPNTAVVDSSVPAAGTTAATGSAVQLVFAAPQAPGGQSATGPTGGQTGGQGSTTGQTGGTSGGGVVVPGGGSGGGGGGGGAGGGGSLVVPGLVGKQQTEAATALAGLGLVPVLRSQYSDEVPAGQIIAQTPEGGSKAEKGGRVTLAVSAGIPNVIFSLDGNLLSTTRAGGRLVATPLAASEEVEDQPTLARNGRLLAYRRGPNAGTGQIWLMDLANPQGARPITGPGFNDRRPAFAPTTQGQGVIAFSSNRGAAPNDTNLCFMTLDQPQPPVQCIVDPSQQLSRPAWSPDGRSIVATVNDNNQDELALFTSSVPFSGNPADWVKQGIVTDRMHGQRAGDRVFSSAFSPNGTQLAITANWGGSPKVWFIPVQGGQLGQATPVSLISACELAWRPDGGELAVSRRTGSVDCTGKGEIVRVDPGDPGDQIVLTSGLVNASDPVWALAAG
jgi:Tol biopolymer transport system component